MRAGISVWSQSMDNPQGLLIDLCNHSAAAWSSNILSLRSYFLRW